MRATAVLRPTVATAVRPLVEILQLYRPVPACALWRADGRGPIACVRVRAPDARLDYRRRALVNFTYTMLHYI